MAMLQMSKSAASRITQAGRSRRLSPFLKLSIAVARISTPGWMRAIGVPLTSNRLGAVEPMITILPANVLPGRSGLAVTSSR